MFKLSTVSTIKSILEKHQFQMKKKYGQNFLADEHILEKITKYAEIGPNDYVLEIGSGIGTLTQNLAQYAKKVVTVEIDSQLIPILQDTLKDGSNIEVLHCDILKLNLGELKKQSQTWKVVANLPYYITTAILMRFLESDLRIEQMTVMMQKEVAQRIQANPGNKDYGILSLIVRYYADVEKVIDVVPACFFPRPKVASIVLNFHQLQKPRVEVSNKKLLFSLIRSAFQQRRKTLLNALSHSPELCYSKEEIGEAIEKCGWDMQIRGERLSLEDFASLTAVLTG